MAVPTTFKFGAGVAYIGDGSVTETFSKLCGFTGADLGISKKTNESSVPDCDDPDAPTWDETDVTSMSWTMKFEGYATKDSLSLIEAAAVSGLTRGVRLYLKGAGAGAGTPDRLYAGKANVQMSISGKKDERWQVSVEVTGSGPLTITSVTIPAA